MGGKAHGLDLGRLPPQSYRAVCQHLRRLFRDELQIDIVIPRTAPEKSDHGDIDVLLPTDQHGASTATPERLADLGFTDCRHKCSYLYRNWNGDGGAGPVQVDIHLCHPDKMAVRLLVESYGDLGVLLGRLVKPMGFTLRPTGLCYDYRIGNHNHVYTITTDAHDICSKYLGLDYAQWQRGFSTETETFQWLLPLRPQASAIALSGIRERPGTVRFVEWLNQQQQRNAIAPLPAWTTDLAIDRLKMHGVWDAVRTKQTQETDKANYQTALAEAFNANLVRQILADEHGISVEPRGLGKWMKAIRLLLPAHPTIPSPLTITGIIDKLLGQRGELIDQA